MIQFQVKILTGITLLAVFFMVHPVMSQAKACKADVAKLCADTKPGKGRVKACLNSHQSDLSSACKEQMARWKAISAACRADRQQFCKDKKGEELKKCIKDNRGKFSDTCKNAVKKARSM